MLQTVPGIVVDRVNVGGSESGQQSNDVANGADTGDNTWNLDGIPIKDMTALGSSPTYYDFDMFQEMQVTTGGADVQASTPGVQLNFVMKSGTNTPRGSARVFFADEDLQGDNLSADLAERLGGASGKGNRTDQYADSGAEFGGPLVSDRWWAWGSYAKTDVRILTLNGVSDRTILEDTGFKNPAQFNDAGSSKSEIYLPAPRYQLIANGFYQGPWGLNFDANLLVREGFGMPFRAKDVKTNDAVDAAKDVLVVSDIGDFRLPTVSQLDLRAEKEFQIGRTRTSICSTRSTPAPCLAASTTSRQPTPQPTASWRSATRASSGSACGSRSEDVNPETSVERVEGIHNEVEGPLGGLTLV